MRTLPQRAPVRLIRRVVARAGTIDASTLAAALTYQALLSLISLVLFAGAAIGFVFADDPAKAQHWMDQVEEAIPGLEQVVGRSIDALVDARVQAGIIAVLALVWTASSLAGRATHAIVKAFGLPDRPWVRRRLLALVEILAVGTIALAGIALTSLTRTAGVALLLGLAVDLVAALAAYVLLTPGGGPGWRTHLPGSMLFGLTLGVLTIAGGWYADVVVARASAVYGAIAAIIGLLAVLSLGSHAFIYGAVLSQVIAARDQEGDDAGASARSERDPST